MVCFLVSFHEVNSVIEIEVVSPMVADTTFLVSVSWFVREIWYECVTKMLRKGRFRW